MVDWIKSLASKVMGGGLETFEDFSQNKTMSLASAMAQLTPLVGVGAIRFIFKKSQSHLFPQGKTNSGQLKKSAQMFRDQACQKLKPGKLDPGLEQAKEKMIKQSQAWGFKLKPDNPIHYLAAIFSDLHAPQTIQDAYRHVKNIKEKITSTVSPKASRKEKMQALYKLVETRFPYAIRNDLFKGIKLGSLDCDTVAMLALFVAHELGWPLKMVYSPNHAFSRWDDCSGTYDNMDLKGTGSKPNEDYAKSLSGKAILSGAYLRSLSAKELIGHFLELKADILKSLQKDKAALKYYNLAHQYAPKNHHALIGRAFLLYSMGQLDRGHADMIAVRKLVPEIGTYITQVTENYRHKKYGAAEKNLLEGFPYPSLPLAIKGISEPKKRVEILLGKIGERLVDLGMKFFKKGDLVNAKKHFKNALALFETIPMTKRQSYLGSLLNLSAHYGMVDYSTGNLSGAYERFHFFNKLGKQIKAHPQALGHHRKTYQKLLEKTLPDQGHIYFKAGKFSEAKTFLKKAISLDPTNKAAQFQLAMTYISLRDYPAAKRRLQSMHGSDPKNVDLQRWLGDVLRKNKDFWEAEVHYEKILKDYPKDIEARIGLAWAKSRHSWRGAKDAIKVFEEVLKLDPKNEKARVGIGRMHLYLKQYPQAKSFFQQVLKAEPKNAEAKSGLGKVYYDMKKYQKAGKIFGELCEAHPKDQSALMMLGMVFYRLNKYQPALEITDQILGKDPKDMDVLAMKGWIAYGSGSYDIAEGYFKTVLKQNLEIKERRAGFVRTKTISNEMCLVNDMDDLAALYGMGMVHYRRGNYQKAHHYLGLALRLDPKDPEIQGDMKRVEAKMKPK